MVIYSGEDDVEVQENVLTQVDLTLIPTSQGKEVYTFGSIGGKNIKNTILILRMMIFPVGMVRQKKR